LRKTVAAVAALVLLGSLVAAMPVSARLQRPQVVRGDGTSAPRAVLGIREDPRGARATKAARAHLRDNSQTYAIEAPDTDLIVEEVIRTDDRATVRFAQQYKGAPVFGAQYLVHMRRSGGGFAAESVNGNFFTDLDVSVAPRFSETAARRLALRR
jgi:bacillolysin